MIFLENIWVSGLSCFQGAGCTGQHALILESRKSRLLISTALDQDCGHQQAERDSLPVYKCSVGKLSNLTPQRSPGAALGSCSTSLPSARDAVGEISPCLRGLWVPWGRSGLDKPLRLQKGR